DALRRICAAVTSKSRPSARTSPIHSTLTIYSPMTTQLHTTISRGLWRALAAHVERTNEPLGHIVSKALAEYLQVSHHTLYQVSTSTALVEGVYEGAVRIGNLREHGDLGLGTFENLDGEMVAVDGQFFHVRSDGSARECRDDELSPFAVVTRFA